MNTGRYSVAHNYMVRLSLVINKRSPRAIREYQSLTSYPTSNGMNQKGWVAQKKEKQILLHLC